MEATERNKVNLVEVEDKADNNLKKRRKKKPKGMRWNKIKAGRKYAEVALWKNNREGETCAKDGGSLSTINEDISREGIDGDQEKGGSRLCKGQARKEASKIRNNASLNSPCMMGHSN